MFERIIAALALSAYLAPPIGTIETDDPGSHRGDGMTPPPAGRCFADLKCKKAMKGQHTMAQCSAAGGKAYRLPHGNMCAPLSRDRDDFLIDKIRVVEGKLIVSGHFVIDTATTRASGPPSLEHHKLRPLRWILPPYWTKHYQLIKDFAESMGYETVDVDKL